jgi:type I restriction enzyme, S subunit
LTLTISVADIVEESDEVLLAKHESWARVRLDNIATILNGYAFQSKHFSKEKGIPLLRIRDVGTSTTECKYTGQYEEKYLVTPCDFVVGMDGDFKCARWNGPTALLNQRVCKIKTNRNGYVPRFLELVLPGYLEAIGAHTSSQTVKHLSSSSLGDLPLPLPPLAEQERIVTQIDQLLSRVNIAREHLSRVPAILKRFRQAVLAAACSGRLTEDWREEQAALEPTSELIVRISKERQDASERKGKSEEDGGTLSWMPLDNRQLPDRWSFIRLAEVLHYKRAAGYGVLQPGDNVSDGVPMVRVCDLEKGTVLVGQLKRIAPTIEKQYQRTRLQGNEVLVTLVGTIGRTAVAPMEIAGANVARAIAMLPLCPHLIPRYVQYALAEPIKNQELWNLAREVARKTLNLGLLKAVQIPLPPLSEQREIVRRVECLLKLADTIETHTQAATTRVEALTRSILSKAFRGELVPTEAELARREGREYEPASVLLKRIKKERERETADQLIFRRASRAKSARMRG